MYRSRHVVCRNYFKAITSGQVHDTGLNSYPITPFDAFNIIFNILYQTAILKFQKEQIYEEIYEMPMKLITTHKGK